MVLAQRPHGDRQRWLRAIAQLPDLAVSNVDFNQDHVSVSTEKHIDAQTLAQLKALMMRLHPWRKGPFDLFGMQIDSEWRSNLKWQRIAANITNLENRLALDVGCGNGYYLWRMLGGGAKLAIGIDPTQLFLAQFNAINRYVQCRNAFILPFKAEEFALPQQHSTNGFDTVFSMGIYYHRRFPKQHLSELFGWLRPGGELVLETLVIAGNDDELAPPGRYAQMRNVWHIPTVDGLLRRLQQSGFEDAVLIDLSATSVNEQRPTDWMRFDSLADFLDPLDSRKTIEGYAAPLRACITAKRPIQDVPR